MALKEKIYCIVGYAVRAKRMYDKTHIAAYSAEAAFFVLVSAVPVMMLAIIMLGILEPFDITGINRLLRQIFAEKLSAQMTEIATEIAVHSTIPLMSAAMLFLLWAATRGIRSIADGIAVVYGTAGRYGIIKLAVRSMAFLAVVLVAAMVAVPLAFSLFKLRWAVIYGMLTLLFSVAYFILAESGLTFKQNLYGGAFAAGGWVVFSFGYSVYIRHFSKYSLLYGSLGAVMLFMLWLYMCMNILLCGALFNKMRKERGKCD